MGLMLKSYETWGCRREHLLACLCLAPPGIPGGNASALQWDKEHRNGCGCGEEIMGSLELCKYLLSVSASRGYAFRRRNLNGQMIRTKHDHMRFQLGTFFK